jgi:hypothetical protein
MRAYRPRQRRRKQFAHGLILGRTCRESGRPIGFVSARQPSRPADDGELITYCGDSHIITIAPTGTGKTAGPVICNALVHPGPAWPDIVDASDWLRHDLGVSRSLWGDACLAMGRELAAVALAIVSTKDEEHFRTSPGGYFHGMVAKAKAGELHLERTVWALRRASEPDHHPRSGKGGDRFGREEAGRGEACLMAVLSRPGSGAGWPRLEIAPVSGYSTE